MEQKGSMLLKVMSIIMIVGGIIGAVGSVIMAAFAGLVTAISSDASLQAEAAKAGTSMTTVTGVIWVGVALLVISAVLEIIAGVKGKKNWNNPESAVTLIVWGAICVVVSVIGSIVFATSGGSAIVSVLTGIVVPILYIIGAVQLKGQA